MSRGFPVAKSISFVVSSLEAVASISPQGLHLTEMIYPIYHKKLKKDYFPLSRPEWILSIDLTTPPDLTSSILRVLSSEELTRTFPSLCQSIQLISFSTITHVSQFRSLHSLWGWRLGEILFSLLITSITLRLLLSNVTATHGEKGFQRHLFQSVCH